MIVNLLHDMGDNTREEAKTAKEFCKDFVVGAEMEDKFWEAISDTHMDGFREGINVALQLLIECNGKG